MYTKPIIFATCLANVLDMNTIAYSRCSVGYCTRRYGILDRPKYCVIYRKYIWPCLTRADNEGRWGGRLSWQLKGRAVRQ